MVKWRERLVDTMIIEQIKNIENLTIQEQAVVAYILDNPRGLLKMSINDLAKESFTSSATIVRLCKKLGLSGYAELKRQFTMEYPNFVKFEKRLKKQPFNNATTLDDVLDGLILINSKTLEYTKSMLDRDVLLACADYIANCQHLGIYGDGLNFEIAKMYAYKFEEVGINAVAYSSTHWQYIKRLQMEKTPTFNILLSHTGKNPNIVNAAKQLKENQLPTLAISGVTADKRLKELCTYHLSMMISRNTLELSNHLFSLSTQYILDILVMAMLSKNYKMIEAVNNTLGNARDEWQNE